jgi:hypothetical protein
MRSLMVLAVSTVVVAAAACANGSADDLSGLGDPGTQDAGAHDAAHPHDASTSTPPPPPPPTDDGSSPPPADDSGTDASSPPPPMDASGPPPSPDAPMGGAFCVTSGNMGAGYAAEYLFAEGAGTLTTCDGTTGAGCAGSLYCCYVPITGSPGCVLK